MQQGAADAILLVMRDPEHGGSLAEHEAARPGINLNTPVLRSERSVAGLPAVELTLETGIPGARYTFVVHNGVGYVFGILPGSEQALQEYLDEYETMLASVEFL